MASKTRAVIDVGTNSVKLLVGDVREGEVTPLLEKSEQTRLGRGFYTDNILRPEAIELTAQAVALFANEARRFDPESIRVVATSAARDALNQTELLNAIEREAGLKVEVITGHQEAQWAYAGATLGGAFRDSVALVVDIGGGSTELNLGYGGRNRFTHSFPLGSVRLLERFPVSDPPAEAEQIACERFVSDFVKTNVCEIVHKEIEQLSENRVTLVATGGTATILARVHLGLDSFDRDRLEGAQVTTATLQEYHARFWSMSLSERRAVPGIPSKRADVVLGGTTILLGLLQGCGFSGFVVSTRGLRFAALLDTPALG